MYTLPFSHCYIYIYLNVLQLNLEPTLPLSLLVIIMCAFLFFGKQFESNWLLLNHQDMVNVTVESANVTKDGLGMLASTQLIVI